ncbi:MAG: hypothetical protein CVU56_02880 [Deltaproteobacteria bacterium HGW-Deltaproteobacteria-14]|nr:MAG: hypothetical protein CVU56_02880 [Deltaproteobacteria bacterium HGW-Deltaproteobacteria-14]
MAEKLLINVAHEETRVALVESGKIQNLEIDTSRVDNNKGNIYKGVVHRVNQSLQAAFVDYGAEKQGFLPLSEIHSRYYPKALKGKKATIQDVLIQGQELMVQIVKDEIGNKGASLTTFISLPGRYVVLMADSDKTGISRRVESDERTRLKGAIDELPVPDGFGLIVRTNGVGRDKDELAQDLEYLSRLWSNLQEHFRTSRGAGIIHQERHIALRFIRDYAHSGIDEIVVDNKDVYDEIVDFCTALAPELKSKVRQYADSRPLFSRYQIEDQIDDIFARRIDLASGGSIVIDQTEALVAIDVNSGRVKTDDIEQTALTTNLEAAAEVARQLKIRDRGGLVVVDFIDMRSKDNIRKVEQAVKDAFASDKAKVKFSKISDFGLMEISRQRLQSSIMTGSFTSCRACGGTGRVRSVESSALYLLRRLKETVIRGNYMHAQARMTTEIANYLVNRKRRELVELEAETQTTIEVHADDHCPPMVAYVELLSRPGKSKRPRRVLQTIDLVRSDVEKRELDDDEEVILDITERRTGWTPPGQDRGDLEAKSREIEAAMALEKERLRAQQEADESRQRQLELEAQTRLTEARTELLKERERLAHEQLGLWGRIKRWFGASPPLEDQNAPVGSVAAVAEPSAQPEARRQRPVEAKEADDRGRGQRTRASGGRSRTREDRASEDAEGKSTRGSDRGRSDGRGDRSERSGRGGRGDRDRGGRSDRGDRGRRGDRDKEPNKDERAASPNASGDEPKSDKGERDARGDRDERGRGRGRKRRDEGDNEVTEESKDATAAANADGAPGAGETPASTEDDDGASRKKRRRRRRRKTRADESDGDQASADGDDSDGDSDDSDDDGDSDDTPPQRGRGDRRGGSRERQPREQRRSDQPESGASSSASQQQSSPAKRPTADAPAPATRPAVPRAGGVIDLRAGVVDLRSPSSRPATGPARSDRARVEPARATESKADAKDAKAEASAPSPAPSEAEAAQVQAEGAEAKKPEAAATGGGEVETDAKAKGGAKAADAKPGPAVAAAASDVAPKPAKSKAEPVKPEVTDEDAAGEEEGEEEAVAVAEKAVKATGNGGKRPARAKATPKAAPAAKGDDADDEGSDDGDGDGDGEDDADEDGDSPDDATRARSRSRGGARRGRRGGRDAAVVAAPAPAAPAETPPAPATAKPASVVAPAAAPMATAGPTTSVHERLAALRNQVKTEPKE